MDLEQWFRNMESEFLTEIELKDDKKIWILPNIEKVIEDNNMTLESLVADNNRVLFLDNSFFLPPLIKNKEESYFNFFKFFLKEADKRGAKKLIKRFNDYIAHREQLSQKYLICLTPKNFIESLQLVESLDKQKNYFYQFIVLGDKLRRPKTSKKTKFMIRRKIAHIYESAFENIKNRIKEIIDKQKENTIKEGLAFDLFKSEEYEYLLSFEDRCREYIKPYRIHKAEENILSSTDFELVVFPLYVSTFKPSLTFTSDLDLPLSLEYLKKEAMNDSALGNIINRANFEIYCKFYSKRNGKLEKKKKFVKIGKA